MQPYHSTNNLHKRSTESVYQEESNHLDIDDDQEWHSKPTAKKESSSSNLYTSENTQGSYEQIDTFGLLASKIGIAEVTREVVKNTVIALSALTLISIIGAIVASTVAALSWAVIPLALSAVIYGILPLFCAAHKAHSLLVGHKELATEQGKKKIGKYE